MRISKIEINGFGKLSDYTVEFDKDITSFNEVNGWGKSTLAAFIRVMFYGFENEGKRDNKEKEREHYRPWNGGVYGGSIWFSVGDKNYYLNRVFTGKKEDEQFTLKDADTNLDTKDFVSSNNNIGEAIFGVDAAGYMRTSYISRDYYDPIEMEQGVSDKISAKLGRLTEDTNDVNNYESIKKQIKKASSSLNGKSGNINTVKAEINTLEREVLRKSNLEKSLKELNLRLDAERKNKLMCENKLSELDSEYRESSDAARIVSLAEQYKGLLDKVKEAEEKISELKKLLPDNIPSIEEIDECIEEINNKERMTAVYEESRLTNEEASSLSDIKAIFADRLPNAEEINNKLDTVGSIKIDLTRLNTIDMSDDDIKRLEELRTKYSDKVDKLSEVETAFSDVNVRNGKNLAMSANESKLLAAENELKRAKEDRQRNSKSGATLMFCFAGLLLLLAAICILLGIKNIPVLVVGAIILLAALALAIIAIVKLSSSGKKVYDDPDKEAEIKNLKAIIASDREAISLIDKRMESLLSYFNLSINNDSFNTLSHLKDDLSEYKALLDKEKKYKDSELHEQIRQKKLLVTEYLDYYKPAIQYDEAENYLYELRNMLQSYIRLNAKNEKSIDNKQKIHESNDKIQLFMDKYKLDGEDERRILNRLKNNISEYELVLDNRMVRQKELEAFISDKDIKQLEAADSKKPTRELSLISNDMESYKAELLKTNENIGNYNDIKSGYVEDLSDIEDKEAEIIALKEKLSEYEKSYKILSSFDSIITDAKQSLSLRFTKPVLDSFSKYIDIVLDENKEFVITPDMSIQFREAGNYRDPRSLSSGYKDFVDFALRLGLTDSMYEHDKPVLILDDPFINIDEDKLLKIPKLLEAVAKDYQIIYFTCHSSRGLE